MQDFMLNLLTARFDENRGVWAYTLSDMFKLYLKGWFFIDVVSTQVAGCACRRTHMTSGHSSAWCRSLLGMHRTETGASYPRVWV